MQYSFATVLALAASSVAAYGYSNDTAPPAYTTVVVPTVVTVCPPLATITVGTQTYTNTNTQASTITCSSGPYTVVTPVYTRSSVPAPTYAPAPPAPVYPVNATTPAKPAPPAGTGAAPTKPAPLPASGASKAFAMSGASLVGLMGLAAYLL